MEDWDACRAELEAWWAGKGLALCVTAPKDEPWAAIEKPATPTDIDDQWLDVQFRIKEAEYAMANTYFGGAAFPYFDTQLGPGSLGTFLGSEPSFAEDTVWYHPCMTDLVNHPPITFDPNDRWFKTHVDMMRAGMDAANGRYLVGIPDLIENIDTLAQMRDPQTLLMDMIESPDEVEKRVWEINQAFFEAFDRMFKVVRDPLGGNAFSAFKIWGPGKTAKVQCDASAMFSPEMFHRFVKPALTEQCAWLDYAMYHLDGTQCFVHLDELLDIEPLRAIEWTPQAGIEEGGSPRWYDIYRRIKAGGKSVQAINVKPEEVEPLIDAVGPEGLFIMCRAESEAQARKLIERVRG